MTSIVLADDHLFLRAGVEAVLGRLGMSILASVDHGTAALAAIERHDPDIVILDVNMPGMNGITVLETIRARGDSRPVILLTADLDDTALLAAVRAGVNAIVFKQGEGSSLQDAIASVIAGKRAIDPTLLDRALTLTTTMPRLSPLEMLNQKERQIAEAVALGMRNREIAIDTGMSEGAIKVCLHRIYEKLCIDNRTELAAMVLGGKGK
ncbi:response regulator transcription factor [Novosphingobium sp. PY1]|uniref:Flagellar transcriptional regulator FtcR n=1 Tax=Ochrobactrum sp. PW1 TaxID=1882222 RepID=A0A292GS37_9HYPH|nr:response regulator transcription factor [Novosphingobium sp. PY1]BBA74269.1 two component LuxR family transcriptional regulator [Ochrobactrum sp. PW1]GFM29118.1 Two component LuxR family transcriptional regula tor [Novosphingobium sp. PY1]